MPLPLEVFRSRTLVPVRFARAAEGPPRADAPEVDDRGHAGPEPEGAVGVMEGEVAAVRVLRQDLEASPSARLYVVSSDPGTAAVAEPPHGALPPAPGAVFRIRAVKGGEGIESRRAWMEVHAGAPTGPLLARLAVHVFRPFWLRVALHPVRIRGTGGEGSPAVDPAAVLEFLRAIWRPCGIAILSGPPRPEEAVFARAGTVQDGPWSTSQGLRHTELDRLLGTGRIPEAVNVYLVRRLGSGAASAGFPPRAAAAFRLGGPGIVAATVDEAGKDRDAAGVANDIAHQIGHFLGLEHPGRRSPPAEREDLWSRRRLMHPFNPLPGRDPWPRKDAAGKPFAERPHAEDVGYGPGNRGALLTLREVPGLDEEAEALRARRALVRPEGVY